MKIKKNKKTRQQKVTKDRKKKLVELKNWKVQKKKKEAKLVKDDKLKIEK